MWNYIWPVLLVVGANTFYHICSKSTPDNVQPFATLVALALVRKRQRRLSRIGKKTAPLPLPKN